MSKQKDSNQTRSAATPGHSRQPTPSLHNNVCCRTRSHGLSVALGLALVVATFAAHYPAVSSGYIWDDNISLYDNPLITAPGGLYKIWFTTQDLAYWPLTSTVFWVEWRIWGNNPTPYHVVNIIFHCIAAVLLWRVLLRLTIGGLGSILAAIIFAVHPVTVESVAWISEMKNVLSLPLALLAILAYLRFEDEKHKRWYVFALLFGLAALLAKSSVVMLPIVLLICIWQQRSYLALRDFLRTLPFFAMSLAAGLMMLWTHHHNAIGDTVVRPEGLASRIASVGWTTWFYLYKLVAPINLAMIYPRWDIDGGRILSYVPLALLIAGFAVLWGYRKSWGHGPPAAVGSYAIVLAPVLGLLDMSFAQQSLVADHLQYQGMPAIMTLIGSGIAAVWFWTQQKNRPGLAAGIAALTCIIVLTLAVLTWRQAWVYKDSETLWDHTLQLNDHAWMAHYNRANAYDKKGDYDHAIKHFTKAIELKPEYIRSYNNRGNTYLKNNEPALAIKDLSKAIELKPDIARFYFNRGVAYAAMRLLDPAIRDYTKSIELDPNDAESYDNRSSAYSYNGDFIQAIRDCNKAIELKPTCAQSYNNRGAIYGQMGDNPQAIQDFTKAVELQPDYAGAFYNRGLLHAGIGQHDRAIQDFTKSVKLNPNNASAYLHRASALYSLKEYDKAWTDLKKGRRLGGTPNPDLLQDLIKASGRTD